MEFFYFIHINSFINARTYLDKIYENIKYKQQDMDSLLKFSGFIAILISFTYAIGHECRQYHSTSILYVLVFGIILIQTLAFIPAKIYSTEKFYDLTGSLTYLLSIVFLLKNNPEVNMKQWMGACMVGIWALRLGTFLFNRVMKSGGDSRFKEVKKSALKFYSYWLMQAAWIIVTASPVFVLLASKEKMMPITIVEIIGLIVWGIGFGIEAIADSEKYRFNREGKNKGRFIKEGLWKYSRHPNYFGEIILWVGVAIFCWKSLVGSQRLSLISPIFVYFLLTRISGIPSLEKKAEMKWGEDEEYKKYKKNTPVLFPRLFGGEQLKGSGGTVKSGGGVKSEGGAKSGTVKSGTAKSGTAKSGGEEGKNTQKLNRD